MNNQELNVLLGFALGQFLPYIVAFLTASEWQGYIKALVCIALSILIATAQLAVTTGLDVTNISTALSTFVAILVASQQHYLMFKEQVKFVEANTGITNEAIGNNE